MSNLNAPESFIPINKLKNTVLDPEIIGDSHALAFYYINMLDYHNDKLI